MYALEVLQHYPSQRRTLLATISTVDLDSSNHIMFNLDNYQSRLSHQLAFQIDVVVHNQQIHRTILDEGASTCVMSLAYWKGLKYPQRCYTYSMGEVFIPMGFYSPCPSSWVEKLSLLMSRWSMLPSITTYYLEEVGFML
jgi:hypothetical protein